MASKVVKYISRNRDRIARYVTTNFTQKSFRSTQAEVDVHERTRRPEIGQAETLLDIGTRNIFTEEHDIFRQHVRRFFRTEIIPNQKRYEAQGHVDRELWRKLGSAGMLAVNIPAEKGGIGGDYKASMIVTEEQGYTNVAGSSFTMHSDIVMPYLAEYGTEEQIEKFIPPMTAGEKVGALAMTEPQAGSDLQGIKTYARRDGDDWILNGSKVFITNGYLADTIIVVAVTNPEAKKVAHGLTLFVLEDGMPGFQKGKPLDKVGNKSTDTNELFFDGVRLQSSHVLGGEEMVNKGFYVLMKQLSRERLNVGVLSQSHAEFVFEITRDYVNKRKAFGKRLSDLQTIQHRLATMKTELCVARAFVDQCIQLQEDGILDASSASMCKYWSSDLSFKVANECLQLHGGWGYMQEYPVANSFVDSRLYSIYAGSNEIMRELISRDIVTPK